MEDSKQIFWGNLSENDCWKITYTHCAPKESMRLLPQTGICFINEYSVFLKLASEQLKTSASLLSKPLQSFTWIIGGQGLYLVLKDFPWHSVFSEASANNVWASSPWVNVWSAPPSLCSLREPGAWQQVQLILPVLTGASNSFSTAAFL